MTSELKPCPFCGELDGLETERGWVRHDSVNADCPAFGVWRVAAWNRRRTPMTSDTIRDFVDAAQDLIADQDALIDTLLTEHRAIYALVHKKDSGAIQRHTPEREAYYAAKKKIEEEL